MYCYADCRIRPRQHELVVEFLGGILLVAGFICGVIFRRLCRAMALESIEALVVRSR
jgi:hypothetical protein